MRARSCSRAQTPAQSTDSRAPIASREVSRHKALDPRGAARLRNERTIPREHGGPVRVIILGWYATDSIKWLDRIWFAHKNSTAPSKPTTTVCEPRTTQHWHAHDRASGTRADLRTRRESDGHCRDGRGCTFESFATALLTGEGVGTRSPSGSRGRSFGHAAVRCGANDSGLAACWAAGGLRGRTSGAGGTLTDGR